MILPAIDLRAGRVVRLQQGDFGRETVFGDDPVLVARELVQQGSRWLHVVDLDGARTGEPVASAQVAAIVAAVRDSARVEVGGGLRTPESVRRTLASGAARVALGTIPISDHRLMRALLDEHGPERVAVAVDVRDGQALGQGWARGVNGLAPDELIARLADAGIATFEVTAIERDGLSGGPDLGLLERLVELGRGEVIASGGIRDVADLAAVRGLGCAGAIIGRALYDGSLTLEAALSA